MKSFWPHQEAKNRLSELVDTAQSIGAQTITRHGRPEAVVVSAEEYARLRPSETLAEILLDCPVKDWKLDREVAEARDLDFN